MKKLISILALTLASTTAFAGSYVAPMVDVTVIEEPTRMGGSGAWLIPLVIIAVLALALTSGDDEEVIVTGS
ncbi:MAG: hypothetical protein JKY31_05475 [Rhodobacteraceae bacterium]|nr:hypothetical protein [Paracoccaceae bacterium]